MRTLVLTLILAGLGLHSGPVHAEATATQVLKTYQAASDDGKTYLRGYMIGLVTAYAYANVALKAREIAPMYCVSEKEDLQDEDVVSLMRHSIREDAELGKSPFGMALLMALTRRFPCAEKKK